VLRVSGVLAAAAFVGLLAYGLASQTPSRAIDGALAQAERVAAPSFDLEVLEVGKAPAALRSVTERATVDGRVGLKELRGTPLVLNLWASWCPPCRDETPLLEREWRRSGLLGVMFVGVDTQDVRAEGRAFLREFGVSYLNVRDPGKTTSRRYGATGLPETFFITRDGKVVGHIIGAINREQLRAGIAAARSDRPAAAEQGGARRPTR
jgi:cytochrome c biogenesis protein CcmG, thiol:disulfide interchange protein DsbE